MERNNDYETGAIVIGGGLAGLTAATYLARSGMPVVLFEKSSTPGGRAASQQHDGYTLNLGAHALYDKSPAVEVLRELGIAYSGGSPIGVRCASAGKFHLAPVDPITLLRTGLLSSRARWEAGRLLLKLQLAHPDAFESVSLAGWLDREARLPEVRRLLEAGARVTTYTNAPGELSMGAFIEQLHQVAKGKVVYVDGGWQTLVDGLEHAARDAGARIEGGARVEAVEHGAGRVTGVRLANGATYRAGAVVLAVGPRDALQLIEGENSDLRRWAERSIPVEAACLDVALRRLPQPVNKVVMDIDRPLFLTVQSEFSRVAPQGGAVLYALKYLDPAAPQDPEADKRDLEEWLALTQPGWQAEVIERRYLPHLLVSNALVRAATGGLSARPGPQVPSIRNLYVAGDWVGPTGLLSSASLSSGRQAARLVLANRALSVLGQAA
jgi:phytoene dehydrogenase-like protein